MPSSDPIQRFQDILFNIARIETHTAIGMKRPSKKAPQSMTQSNAALNGSAKPRRNWVLSLKRFALRFPGRKYAASATSCGMNTTAWKAFASGTWCKTICPN